MPLIIDPTAPPKAAPRVVVSPDEQLAAWVTPSGIQLRSRFRYATSIIDTNHYPDPSHEYGIAPMNGTPTGSGAVTVEDNPNTGHIRTGTRSLRFDNTAPWQVARRNLAWRPNPTGTTGWTAGSTALYTAVRVSDVVRRPGTMSVRGGPVAEGQATSSSIAWLGSTSSIWSQMPADPNTVYTVSAWWQANIDNARPAMYVYFYDSAGTILATNNQGVQPSTTPADTWTRSVYTPPISPPGTVAIRLAINHNPPVGRNSLLTDAVWVTDVQIDVGTEATEYHDGDMAANDTYRYRWVGPAGASVSEAMVPDLTAETALTGDDLSPMITDLQARDRVTLAAHVWEANHPALVDEHPVALGLTGTAFAEPVYAPAPDPGTFVQTSATAEVVNPAGTIIPVLYGPIGSDESKWYDDFGLSINTGPVDFNGSMPTGTAAVGQQMTGTTEHAWTGPAGQSPSIRTITVWPDGWELRKIKILRDGIPVRSADPAWAVGGVANAFDHEAPLDHDATYQAIPVFSRAPSLPATGDDDVQPDWAAGMASQPLTIRTPDLPDDKDCWLRSTNDPAAELALEVQGDPETSYQGRDTLTNIQGSTLQAGGIDTLVLQPRTYVFKTYDQAELDALISLLTPAHVLLLQLRTTVGIADIYCVRGSVTVAWFRGSGWPERLVTVELKPVPRPSTLDSPLVIPGHSYADLHAAAATHADVARTFPSYRDQLAIPEEVTL